MTKAAKLPFWGHIIAIGLIVVFVEVLGSVVPQSNIWIGGIAGGLGAAWMIYGVPITTKWIASRG